MARRLVTYDDIAQLPLQSVNGDQNINGKSTTSSTSTTSSNVNNNSKRLHWTEEGKPITASAARKYKKVLQLLANDKIDDAENMLKSLGPEPQKSTEIQEAIVWSKKKRKGNSSNTDATSSSNQDVTVNGNGKQAENVVNGTNVGEDDDDDEQSDDPIEVGSSTTWQNPLQTGNGKSSKKQKSLSHAEIWDDSALIDAWDAAMEEYKQFDEMRKAASNQQIDRSGKSGEKRQREDDDSIRTTPSKRSSLWHDSPDKVNQKSSADNQSDLLPKRKLEAKQLLASILDEEEDEVDESEVEENEGLEDGINTDENTTKHQTDDQPPNTTQQQILSQEEVLQNLAMSWYYAGYYQAMAMQMTQK